MHGDEYRARAGGLHPGPTIEDLRGLVREPKAARGFDTALEQRLAYPMSEVGEAAKEVLGLTGNAGVGRLDDEKLASVRMRLGEEIYDAAWNLPDLAGVDLEDAFQKKAERNEGREW